MKKLISSNSKKGENTTCANLDSWICELNSSIIKLQCLFETSLTNLQEKINFIKSNLNHRENREKKLVIQGLSYNGDDQMQVKNLFDYIDLKWPTAFIRLSPRTANYPGPIICEFKSAADAKLILANSWKLMYSKSFYRVFLNPHLTRSQRIKNSKLKVKRTVDGTNLNNYSNPTLSSSNMKSKSNIPTTVQSPKPSTDKIKKSNLSNYSNSTLSSSNMTSKSILPTTVQSPKPSTDKDCKKIFETVKPSSISPPKTETESYNSKFKSSLSKPVKGHKLIKMDEYCDKPETHLFIYAIMTNKSKLAKIFLNEGRNELMGCLFASKIYKSYALIDESQQENYEKLALEFETTALKLIDMIYKNDPRESQLLLMRSIPEFGFTTCLQIAKISKDLNFLSHPCPQNLLVKIWYGKLSERTSFLRLFISILLPLIAPIFCLYNDKNQDFYLPDEDEKENNDDNNTITINRIDIDQFYKKENYFERLYSFSQAPIIKFLYDKILYLIFLLIFSYFLLCDFYPIIKYKNDSIKIGTRDIILIIWVYSILIEKIHNFYVNESNLFLTKCKFFISNLWNVIYALAIVLFTIGILFRLMSDNNKYFYASRIILSFDFILWTFNFLHTYTSIRLIGPKLIMIKQMFTELITFIFIVLAFLVGFGVSTHALNYHNIPASLNLVKNVFLPSFFIIPQEYYTRNKMLYVDKCQLNQTYRYLTDEYSIDDCVDKVGSQVALVIYLVYSVFIGILMVNLLIAIFSNTISKVEEESDKLWQYQRYSLIYEYFHKPILIPPFTIFYLFGYLIKLMALIVRKLLGNQSKNLFFRKFMKFSYRYRNGFKLRFKGKNLEKRLIDWENRMFHQFLKNEEKLIREKIGMRLDASLEIYDSLIRKCDSILLENKASCDKANQIYKLLENVEIHLANQN